MGKKKKKGGCDCNGCLCVNCDGLGGVGLKSPTCECVDCLCQRCMKLEECTKPPCTCKCCECDPCELRKNDPCNPNTNNDDCEMPKRKCIPKPLAPPPPPKDCSRFGSNAAGSSQGSSHVAFKCSHGSKNNCANQGSNCNKSGSATSTNCKPTGSTTSCSKCAANK